MALDNFFNKIEKIEQFDVVYETSKIIKENSEYLIELLKNQLKSGKDSDGKKVTLIRYGQEYDFYSSETLENKSKVGGLAGFTGWITNYMSGDFYNFLKLRVEESTFTFWSDVDYFEDIIYQSGSQEQLVQLSKENLYMFRDEILIPQLQIRFNNHVNGI